MSKCGRKPEGEGKAGEPVSGELCALTVAAPELEMPGCFLLAKKLEDSGASRKFHERSSSPP